MKFTELNLAGLWLIKPTSINDSRGFFSELFRYDKFEKTTGVQANFVQDNFSYSKQKGTIRGLHYQAPPLAQGKLVRCTRGEIIDIAVDVRPSSKTYGQHVAIKLSANNGLQLWLPQGFLHGFATLTDNCEVAYKVDNYYSSELDGNIRWNDPELAIDWGIRTETAIISNKDKNAPLLADWQNPFLPMDNT